MLEPVVRSGEHRPLLVPDNLLMVHEANSQQAIENFTGEPRGMPDITGFQTGNQGKCLRPIGARIAGNTGFAVAFGSLLLQIARLGRPAAVQPGPIPPLRIQFNAVGRVGYQQRRLTLPQKPGYSSGVGGVPTQYAVRAAKPHIARPRHCDRRQWRRGILVWRIMQQEVVEILGIEPGQAEIEVRLLEV